ncbi:hypothetical protein RN001_011413 [Aquatica leii]|uniref:Uncharacterized protein n=1 Tax=Aquatica leii TaxID=1421715 RepID=A0AAN7P464_9COLE|nr:hypothetical protein RN001_011413 [Aquatica leii]
MLCYPSTSHAYLSNFNIFTVWYLFIVFIIPFISNSFFATMTISSAYANTHTLILPSMTTPPHCPSFNTSSMSPIYKPRPSTPASLIITPESIRPYPKINKIAKQRKKKERGKSRIYTDTPEKERLLELHNAKQRQTQIKEQRRQFETMDSSSNFSESSTDDKSTDLLQPLPENINESDFLITKFEKKKSVVHYVGKVMTKYDNLEYHISYLRKKPESQIFIFPDVKDKASVNFSDVCLKLPMPNVTPGTNRTSSLFRFSVNLARYNIQ